MIAFTGIKQTKNRVKKLKFIRVSLIVLLLWIYPHIALAHMGARYEPSDGRVIHGLGQYVSTVYSDSENWQLVSAYQTAAGEVPLIYSAYQGINPFLDSIDSTDLLDIVSEHNHPYILIVGLYLLDGTDLQNSYANPDAILNGEWDDTITDIAGRIKAIDAPVFLRPGFEFGTGSQGLHQAFSGPEFISIWNYIWTVFDRENVNNVAWVWNTVNPNQFDYMSYYPGDDFVDWWGVNYFTVSQINNSDSFVEDAAIHGKPVMVCESCPIQNNGTQNSDNWNNWFVPYFNKIKEYNHIKAFVYISDPWDKPGFFDEWPDSRIDSNVTIQSNYAFEMQDSCYIHIDENPTAFGSDNGSSSCFIGTASFWF